MGWKNDDDDDDDDGVEDEPGLSQNSRMRDACTQLEDRIRCALASADG